MADKTVVEQLAAEKTAVADLTGKLTESAKMLTESAAKVTALEASVQALTAERDQFKASAEKATAEKATAEKSAADLAAKVQTLEAQLADPSFKAASTPGADPVPQGSKVPDGKPLSLDQLEKAYLAENDPIKLEALRKQIFEAQKSK
jgi:chromosome segregation ATPase